MGLRWKVGLRGVALGLIGLSACSGKEAVAPSLSVSPTALDFGIVGIGETLTLDVQVENTGGGSLTLLSSSLVDGDPDVFEVVRVGEGALTAGAPILLQITCSPEEEEPYSGQILVRTDPDMSAEVTLVCQGGPSGLDEDGDGSSPAEGDCDDADPAVRPGADEACDGRDTDCDGSTPADETDADGDGYRLCDADCDDTNRDIWPGAPEICDGEDSDCDGVAGDDLDNDGDGATLCDGDCADDEPAVTGVDPERCDGLDNDCSGVADDLDADGDGRSPCSLGGDCDDADPLAYPAVVDASAASGGDGSDLSPFLTLEEAISGLDAVCRTIAVLPGSYTPVLTVSAGAVRVVGLGDSPSEVVVGAPPGARPFTVTGEATSLTLENLTLSGSTGSGDGGAVSVVDGTLTLLDVVASGNQSTGDGGAVAVSSGRLVIDGALFSANIAQDDGGAVAVIGGSLDVVDADFEDNLGVRGGALVLQDASGSLRDGNVQGNEASDEGGGLAVLGGNGLSVEGLTVWSNRATNQGGGLVVRDLSDGSSVLRNLAIQDNVSSGPGGGVAVVGQSAAFTLANNTLLANHGRDGAGLYLDPTDGSGLFAWSNLVLFSSGDSGLYDGPGASAWCSVYGSSSGVDLDGAAAAGEGNNTSDPTLVRYSDDDNPANDDLNLGPGSPAINTGPPDNSWDDRDGTPNDRGSTGGPGGTP